MAGDMSMKMSLVELYELIGDNQGITFYYDDLPGVIVTIGFTKEDDNDGNDDDGSDDGEDDDGGDVGDAGILTGGKGKLH